MWSSRATGSCLERAQNVYGQESFPEEWSWLQNCVQVLKRVEKRGRVTAWMLLDSVLQTCGELMLSMSIGRLY